MARPKKNGESPSDLLWQHKKSVAKWRLKKKSLSYMSEELKKLTGQSIGNSSISRFIREKLLSENNADLAEEDLLLGRIKRFDEIDEVVNESEGDDQGRRGLPPQPTVNDNKGSIQSAVVSEVATSKREPERRANKLSIEERQARWRKLNEESLGITSKE